MYKAKKNPTEIKTMPNSPRSWKKIYVYCEGCMNVKKMTRIGALWLLDAVLLQSLTHLQGLQWMCPTEDPQHLGTMKICQGGRTVHLVVRQQLSEA